jgi:hypothetical protein
MATKMTHCYTCDKSFESKFFFAHVRTLAHKKKAFKVYSIPGVEVIKTAFGRRVVLYRVPSLDPSIIDIADFFIHAKERVCEVIKQSILELGAAKVNFEVFATFFKPGEM